MEIWSLDTNGRRRYRYPSVVSRSPVSVVRYYHYHYRYRYRYRYPCNRYPTATATATQS